MFQVGDRAVVHTPGDDVASRHDHGNGVTIVDVLDNGWFRCKVDGRSLEGCFRASELRKV